MLQRAYGQCVLYMWFFVLFVCSRGVIRVRAVLGGLGSVIGVSYVKFPDSQ